MPASRKPKPTSGSSIDITQSPNRPRQDSTSNALSNLSMSDSPPPTSSTTTTDSSAWTEPPWVGFLETTEDALLILEAARRRLIPRVTRRLADRERRLIRSGSVFVFEEEESGIKRWTDGFLWSPSRILGNFLLYRETDKRSNSNQIPTEAPAAAPSKPIRSGPSSLLVTEEPTPINSPHRLMLGSGTGGYSAAGTSGMDRARERILLGSLTNSQKFKEDGMMKKTFSLTLSVPPETNMPNSPSSTVTHHIVSYYKVADVEAGRLRTPSSLPEFAALEIGPEFLDKTHFRVPPRLEVGEDGRVRYRGEMGDDGERDGNSGGDESSPPPPPPGPSASTSSTSTQARSGHHHVHSTSPTHTHAQHGTHPYHPRPGHSHSRQSSLSSTGQAFMTLTAAAQAQAEASARAYGSARAAANSFFLGGNGVGTNSTPSSFIEPTPLFSSASSSSSATTSRSRSYTTPSFYDSGDSSSYTGAPPFQAPQLYDPSQPSASSNAAFATSMTYPSSLAPSIRSSSASVSAPSVSMSSVSGMSMSAYSATTPSLISGSGGSGSSSGVATPSSSSRRNSTSPMAYTTSNSKYPPGVLQTQYQEPASYGASTGSYDLDFGYTMPPALDGSLDYSWSSPTAPNNSSNNNNNSYVESPLSISAPTNGYFAAPNAYSIPPPANQNSKQQMYDENLFYVQGNGVVGNNGY